MLQQNQSLRFLMFYSMFVTNFNMKTNTWPHIWKWFLLHITWIFFFSQQGDNSQVPTQLHSIIKLHLLSSLWLRDPLGRNNRNRRQKSLTFHLFEIKINKTEPCKNFPDISPLNWKWMLWKFSISSSAACMCSQFPPRVLLHWETSHPAHSQIDEAIHVRNLFISLALKALYSM